MYSSVRAPESSAIREYTIYNWLMRFDALNSVWACGTCQTPLFGAEVFLRFLRSGTNAQW